MTWQPSRNRRLDDGHVQDAFLVKSISDPRLFTLLKVEQVSILVGLGRTHQVLLVNRTCLELLSEQAKLRYLSPCVTFTCLQSIASYLRLFQFHASPFVVRILVAGLVPSRR